MLAALVLERDPLQYQDLPAMLASWVRVVGVLGLVVVVLWLLAVFFGLGRTGKERIPLRQAVMLFVPLGLLGLAAILYGNSIYFRFPLLLLAAKFCVLLTAGVCFLAALVELLLWALEVVSRPTQAGKRPLPAWQHLFTVLLALAGGCYVFGAITGSTWALTAGGACAIPAASFSFLLNLPRFSVRRIGAITRLSFKEALRRRIPYVFALILVIFLFANWYVPYKPETQVNTYVNIVYYAMGPLLLTAAVGLGAFSIPNDIKQQTIHTILTKPVERFEVVLGRFLGFTGLLTIILLVMTALSLVYVMRNVDPLSAAESLRARDPVYGALTFEGTNNPHRPGMGESVGREWEYRSYIAGPMPGKPLQAAVWSFPALPASVADRPVVRCEFAFDVYRLHVGTEGQGLSCDFVFLTHNFKRADLTPIQDELKKAKGPKEREEVAARLAETYGYYERPAKNIEDYHTLFIDVPGGLFRNALKGAPAKGPAIQVRVKNLSTAGYVGMARYDLYFLKDDPNSGMESFWFGVNFFKGAAGVWFRMVLMCGLAVALSTYLSGVISLLITCMLYLGGLFQDFIQTVAQGTNFGGGPLEALFKIATRSNLAAPMEESAVKQITQGSDQVFRYLMRGVLYILPDIDRFALTGYVADGFNIPLSQLVLSFVILLGYLLPWGVLAYFLIKWREIASQT